MSRFDRYVGSMNSELEGKPPEYQRAWWKARRQVRRLRRWYFHAIIFTVVIGLLWLRYWFGPAIADWAGYAARYASRAHYMPIWPTLGWGFALAIHGLVVFGRNAGIGPFSDAWEERHIQRVLNQADVKSS